MSKLRPMKKEEDLNAIPLTEPVLVELEPAATSFETGGAAGGDDATTTAAPDDETVKTLRDQLEIARKENEASNERLQKAERERQEAIRIAQQKGQEAERAGRSLADTERDLIVNSLAAAQSDRDGAKAALAAALEGGDYKAVAEAQSRLSRAEAKILNFEAAAAEIERRIEVEKSAPRQDQRASGPADVMQSIDALPGLMAAERDWLKQHPEAIMDGNRNRELNVAYDHAMRRGLSRGTPDYFRFLDEFMGYAKPHVRTDNDDQNGERNSIVAAPVTRETVSMSNGRPSNSQITLTPEQRELARTMGLSDVQYAREVARLQADKKANPEKYMFR